MSFVLFLLFSRFFCAWPEKVLKTLVRSLTLPKQSSDCFHSRTKYRSRSQKKKKVGSKNTFSSFAGVCTNVQFTLMHCILAHRSSFYLVLESSRSICILFWLGEETSASQYQLYYNSSYPCNASDCLYFDTFGGSGASAGRPFTVRKQKIPMTKDQQFPLFSSIVQLLGLVGCAIVLVLELFIGHQNHLVASAAADPSDAYFLLLLRIRKGISRQPPQMHSCSSVSSSLAWYYSSRKTHRKVG